MMMLHRNGIASRSIRPTFHDFFVNVLALTSRHLAESLDALQPLGAIRECLVDFFDDLVAHRDFAEQGGDRRSSVRVFCA